MIDESLFDYMQQYFWKGMHMQRVKQEIKKAVNKNLKSASRVLSINQYKKYLQILNATLNNNHIADYTK